MSKYTERDMSMAKEKLKMDSAQIAQIMGTVGSPLIVISELLIESWSPKRNVS